MAEIDTRRTAYIDAGWPDVVVMTRGDWFRSWDYCKLPKRKGGRVYVEVRYNGEVTFHEGYLTAKEAARLSSGDWAAPDAAKPQRPEVTSALNIGYRQPGEARVGPTFQSRYAERVEIDGFDLGLLHPDGAAAHCELIGSECAVHKSG